MVDVVISVCIEVNEVEEYNLMNTLCGHNAELVAKINDAWRKNAKEFEDILKALYRRDIDEITSSDVFMIPEWIASEEYRHGCDTDDWTEYNNMALDIMCKYWMAFADNYLHHIADDCDLECILNFLHYPYLPIYK